MYTVTLHPSGRQFESIPHRSILDSGLAHGLALPHRCANGSCGTCTARLLEGATERLRPHDFTLTARDKANGHFLMCCHSPASDVEIVVNEVATPADIPVQKLSAKVERCQTLNDVRVVTLRFTRGRSLQYLSGQSVRLYPPASATDLNSSATSSDDTTVHLDIPIASCPCETGIVELHFQAQQNADLGRHWCELFETAGRRDRIEVEGPYGNFTLTDLEPRARLMVCVDTGFARSKALIEQVFNLEHESPIKLLRFSGSAATRTSAAKTEALYLDNLCRSWQDSMPNFCYESIEVQNTTNGCLADAPITPEHLGNFADSAEAFVYISSAPVPTTSEHLNTERLMGQSTRNGDDDNLLSAQTLRANLLKLGFNDTQIMTV